jgi:hypothetical protein
MMKVQDHNERLLSLRKERPARWEGRAGLYATLSSLRGVFAAPFFPRILECAGDRICLSHSFVNDADPQFVS